MIRMKRSSVRRTKRSDAVLLLRQQYEGSLDSPQQHNAAFAAALRALADKLEEITNAYADPAVDIWMHREGEILAEITLSPAK